MYSEEDKEEEEGKEAKVEGDEGKDEIEGHFTQTFRRRQWPPGMHLPELIRFIWEEIRQEKERRVEELRQLCRELDEERLADYVDEVREINKQEEAQKLQDELDAKRKELIERRQKLKDAQEERRQAREAELIAAEERGDI